MIYIYFCVRFLKVIFSKKASRESSSGQAGNSSRRQFCQKQKFKFILQFTSIQPQTHHSRVAQSSEMPFFSQTLPNSNFCQGHLLFHFEIVLSFIFHHFLSFFFPTGHSLTDSFYFFHFHNQITKIWFVSFLTCSVSHPAPNFQIVCMVMTLKPLLNFISFILVLATFSLEYFISFSKLLYPIIS